MQSANIQMGLRQGKREQAGLPSTGASIQVPLYSKFKVQENRGQLA